MLIAKEKRDSNLAEYILYMWQLEDMFRALELDINKVNEVIVKKYGVDDFKKKEIFDWYDNLIEMMKLERCEKSGHIQVVKNSINELTELHFYLLQKRMDRNYQQTVSLAAPSLVAFRAQSGVDNEVSDVELALNALYGHLMLRLQNKEISVSTSTAMESFSKMLAYLSAMYKKMEEEENKEFLKTIRCNISRLNVLTMRGIIVLLALILNVGISFADNNVRKINKVFSKYDVKELIVSNSYGRIDVEQVQRGNLEIEVTVTADAKKLKKIEMLLSQVDISIENKNASVSCKTNLDKAVNSLIQKIGGKELLVDYKIKVPTGIDVKLINQHGDVIIGDYSGNLNVFLSNGNFTAGNIECDNSFYLKHDKGMCVVGNVNSMDAVMISSDFRMGRCEFVKIAANMSKGYIESVSEYDAVNTDCEINIGVVEDIKCVANSSNLIIDDLGDIMSVDINRGFLFVKSVHYSFDRLNINSNSAKIKLGFRKEAGFNMSVMHDKYTKFMLPVNVKLTRETSSNSELILGRTFVGNKNHKSKLDLRLEKSKFEMYAQ